MAKFNPDIHNRQSIRVKQYDYSANGYYFVTVCAQHREHIFGKIENGVMRLNDVGEMVDIWGRKIFENYNNVRIDQYRIMPNHFHGIINIVGVDPCVDPGRNETQIDCKGRTRGSAPTIPTMIQWFKTMTTNEYARKVQTHNWPMFNKRLWQRNYYERIIRDDIELTQIRQYVIDNPLNWETDEENVKKVNQFKLR